MTKFLTYKQMNELLTNFNNSKHLITEIERKKLPFHYQEYGVSIDKTFFKLNKSFEIENEEIDFEIFITVETILNDNATIIKIYYNNECIRYYEKTFINQLFFKNNKFTDDFLWVKVYEYFNPIFQEYINKEKIVKQFEKQKIIDLENKIKNLKE
jgi:hypothetical protein